MGLGGADHPTCCLLLQFQHRGGDVVLLGEKLTEGQRRVALDRGPYQLTLARVPICERILP